MAFDIFDLISKRVNQQTAQDDPDVPEQVRQFLGSLGMLQGVPLYYLIPDERYLPLQTAALNGNDVEQGAFKFFWLDKEWIECLMDGALSIGADNQRELILTKAMGGNYVAEVFLAGKRERIKKHLSLAYTPEEYKQQFDNRYSKFLNNGKPEPTLAQNNWCYTGFLMRSSIITAWPGLEIVAQGYDPNDGPVTNPATRPLQLVRMENVADDTVFCLCEGIITQVQIKQPPEVMHFGIDADYTVKGKKVSTSAADAYSTGGVVDASTLKNLLGAADAANFAKQMLAAPQKFVVNTTWTPVKN